MHHPDLPQMAFDNAEGRLFAGAFGDATSPARADTPLVGLDLEVRGTTLLPTDLMFEHAIVPLDGKVRVGPEVVEPAGSP